LKKELKKGEKSSLLGKYKTWIYQPRKIDISTSYLWCGNDGGGKKIGREINSYDRGW
jgi:hypothetical protein